MKNREIRILLVGVGGYGENYVNALLDEANKYNVKIVGAVDPNSSSALERLKSQNVCIYNSMEDFYKSNQANLCIISTPIHFHKRQVIYALENGSNVLCEKPAAGCVQDIKEMIIAQEKTGRFCAVGFQASFSDPILQLKQDILDGVWGNPILIKSISLLPRSMNYFSDRSWSGKKYDNQGNCIMDSIASNAGAHALHHMLFMLGNEMDLAAMPIDCNAKLIRVNNIETFDGISARFTLDNGTPILFYAAHPVYKEIQHTFEFQFEKGSIHWTYGGQVEGTFTNGVVKNYGIAGDFICKLNRTLQTIATGENHITSHIKTVLPHTKAVELIGRQLYEISIIDTDDVKKKTFEDNYEGYYLPGLDIELLKCYEGNRLLGDEI